MILGEDPGWMSLKEVADVLGLKLAQMHHLMRRGVYVAQKLDNKVYAIHVDHLPEIADRITIYLEKRPYHPDRSVTVEEAAQCLGVSITSVYALRTRGDLRWAEDETRHFIALQSLRELMWARGLGQPKLRRIV